MAENNSSEKAHPEFSCDLCDFVSNWENGLKIHIGRKHSKIEQLNGFTDLEVEKDEKYKNRRHYWKGGRHGSVYQTFLDALDILRNSELHEDIKTREKEKVLKARKKSFGPNFQFFPRWDKPSIISMLGSPTQILYFILF